jgi:NAD(P)-dependent dehydrogenase (short-subunit alcohol dehydrogenase family)
MQLQDIRGLVSGGASGLGHAVATRIVADGGCAAILDVNAEQGAAAAAALGDRAIFVRADVTDERGLDDAVGTVHEQFGGVDVAVSCAGVGWPKRLVGKDGQMPGEFFRKVVEINLVGTVFLAKSAAARMQLNAPNGEGERGVIVMAASAAAYDGQIGQVAYAASKGGIVSMTLPMARELASSGIRVVSIAPGIFMTPMLAGLPEETRLSLGKQVPFPPRLGRAEEFADLVAHICGNTMLNGETIRLDGAIRMAPR